MRDGIFTEQEYAGQVDAQRLVPVNEFCVLEGRRRLSRGGRMHGDIQPTEPVYSFLSSLLRRVLVAYIGAKRKQGATAI